jgi:cytidylate kinase
MYFDTGVMYRAVTWAALQRGVPIDDEVAVTEVAETLEIKVTPPSQDDGRQYTVYAGGQDVTWAIREPAVEDAVSPVSAYRGVRKTLTEQQRRIAADGCIVMVGRDIGTVVLPAADLKLFIQASVEERARRRYQECQARGEDMTYREVLTSMRRRDRIDSQRTHAPLRPADDAIIIDTDGLEIEEVLARIEPLMQDRRRFRMRDVECDESY